MHVDRESEAGFTLLELSLALALSSAFLAAFFLGYRTFGQSLGMVARGLGATSDAVETVDRMAWDLDHATGWTVINGEVADFLTPEGQVIYRMAQATESPGFAVLTRTVGGTTTVIGPRHAVANYDPFGTGVKDFSNAPAVVAPLFRLAAANPPSIEIQLILQPTRESPTTYVRRVAAPRVFR